MLSSVKISQSSFSNANTVSTVYQPKMLKFHSLLYVSLVYSQYFCYDQCNNNLQVPTHIGQTSHYRSNSHHLSLSPLYFFEDKLNFCHLFFESTKVKVEELEKKVEKLEKRLRKDEKMGVLDGKEERAKRQPSQYNLIIANETKKIKNGTRQDKFTEEVRRYHEMKEGEGKTT